MGFTVACIFSQEAARTSALLGVRLQAVQAAGREPVTAQLKALRSDIAAVSEAFRVRLRKAVLGLSRTASVAADMSSMSMSNNSSAHSSNHSSIHSSVHSSSGQMALLNPSNHSSSG